jgi:hypothetical protein
MSLSRAGHVDSEATSLSWRFRSMNLKEIVMEFETRPLQ